MAKNYKSRGESIVATAPDGGVEAGKLTVIGSLLVVPNSTVIPLLPMLVENGNFPRIRLRMT
jgi:hypothetical protein